MVAETKKILDPEVELIASSSVAVFIGHSEAVDIELSIRSAPTRHGTSSAVRRGSSLSTDGSPAGYIYPSRGGRRKTRPTFPRIPAMTRQSTTASTFGWCPTISRKGAALRCGSRSLRCWSIAAPLKPRSKAA